MRFCGDNYQAPPRHPSGPIDASPAAETARPFLEVIEVPHLQEPAVAAVHFHPGRARRGRPSRRRMVLVTAVRRLFVEFSVRCQGRQVPKARLHVAPFLRRRHKPCAVKRKNVPGCVCLLVRERASGSQPHSSLSLSLPFLVAKKTTYACTLQLRFVRLLAHDCFPSSASTS